VSDGLWDVFLSYKYPPVLVASSQHPEGVESIELVLTQFPPFLLGHQASQTHFSSISAPFQVPSSTAASSARYARLSIPHPSCTCVCCRTSALHLHVSAYTPRGTTAALQKLAHNTRSHPGSSMTMVRTATLAWRPCCKFLILARWALLNRSDTALWILQTI
jgi:hypothetical protein